jgi:hypothetical protein
MTEHNLPENDDAPWLDTTYDGFNFIEEYRKQNKKQTLWDVMRDKLGFSIDMCDEIVDAVEEWLPPQHDTNDYQWNKCIQMMKEKLR